MISLIYPIHVSAMEMLLSISLNVSVREGKKRGKEEVVSLSAAAVSTTSGFSLPTMFFFLLISLSAIIGYVVYRQKRSGGSFSALHFDNPVYRRTVCC